MSLDGVLAPKFLSFARRAHLEIQPIVDIPPRFVAARLYDEQFAIAVRTGHPFAKRGSNTLTNYCAAANDEYGAAYS